jgi:8-oxo-dGTP pyrophosphatase MutT (NUDIX family)
MLNPKAVRMFAQKTADASTRVKVGVGVVIVDAQGRILLERRSDNGMWGLPGGKMEPGESLCQTALREVKEETGLEVRLTNLVGVYSEPAGRIITYPEGDVCHLVDIIIKAEIVSGELTLSSESLELNWFLPDALPAAIVPPAVQPIQDHVSGLCSVIH